MFGLRVVCVVFVGFIGSSVFWCWFGSCFWCCWIGCCSVFW